ncbi:TPA: AHH domain-containing protein, partial [Enterobacter kobei]|nr:AHH domain-containing protein [Enterobacter kobei]
ADYHPTRTIHSGSHPVYTKNIGDQMDAIYEYGKENGWKQAEYKQAVSEIIKNERADLRGGKTILNKNSVRKARC